MSEKAELQKCLPLHNADDRFPRLERHRSTWRSALSAVVIAGMLIWSFFHVFPKMSMLCHHSREHTQIRETFSFELAKLPSITLPALKLPTQAATTKKVTLEAHIMSKCPDARDCLRDLVVPAMANISERVDFTLSFIGHINPPTSSDPITCKHGPTECLGDILELCAASLYPSPKIHLGFALCMSMDYTHIPQRGLVQACALEHGMDFGKLNQCASAGDGSTGMELLRGSVGRSGGAGVEVSCTVRLNDKVRCVRDGGEWKDCPGGSSVEDLIRDVNKAAAESA